MCCCCCCCYCCNWDVDILCCIFKLLPSSPTPPLREEEENEEDNDDDELGMAEAVAETNGDVRTPALSFQSFIFLLVSAKLSLVALFLRMVSFVGLIVFVVMFVVLIVLVFVLARANEKLPRVKYSSSSLTFLIIICPVVKVLFSFFFFFFFFFFERVQLLRLFSKRIQLSTERFWYTCGFTPVFHVSTSVVAVVGR